MWRQEYSSTEIANLVGELRYWEGVYDQSVNEGVERSFPFTHISFLIKEYKERVPESLQKDIEINLGKLESLCFRGEEGESLIRPPLTA